MQPDFHLTEPKPGDKITALRETNMVKAVKALQPSVGFGMMISRNNNGVMYSVKKGEVTGVASRTKMPFDCQLILQEPDTTSIQVHVLKGRLYYGAGNSLVEVQPTDVVADDYWDLSVTVSDGLMLGVVCSYDEYSETSIPETFTVGSIPPDAALLTEIGLRYYPLVRFIKLGPEEEYGGPSIFSFQVPVEDSETDERDTYYAIQCHHGDIVFDHNDYSPWVGVVNGTGGNGSYYVSGKTVNVVEIAGSTTIPDGSRILVHRIMCESLAAGQTSTSENDS